MATKKSLITIPDALNKKLSAYKLEIEDVGVKLNKAELIIHLTELGLKYAKEYGIEK